jgi:hypothetical protein
MSTGERLPLDPSIAVGNHFLHMEVVADCNCHWSRGDGSTESKAPGREVRHAAGSPGVLGVGDVRVAT